jgi:hypothetical protein
LNGQYVSSEGKDGDTIAASSKSDINTLYQFVPCFEFFPAIGVPSLQPAGIACPMATIGSILAQAHTLVFLPEEVLGYSGIYVLPGQYPFQGSLPIGIEGGVKLVFLEGLQPVTIVKTFLPGIKPAAQFPRPVYNFTEPSVAAGHYRLKLAGFRVLPRKVDSKPAQALLEQFMFRS